MTYHTDQQINDEAKACASIAVATGRTKFDAVEEAYKSGYYLCKNSITPPAPDTTAEGILKKHQSGVPYWRTQQEETNAILAAMTDYAHQKQREVAVAFAQWSYGLKRIVNEESFHSWLTNIYNK